MAEQREVVAAVIARAQAESSESFCTACDEMVKKRPSLAAMRPLLPAWSSAAPAPWLTRVSSLVKITDSTQLVPLVLCIRPVQVKANAHGAAAEKPAMTVELVC